MENCKGLFIFVNMALLGCINVTLVFSMICPIDFIHFAFGTIRVISSW